MYEERRNSITLRDVILQLLIVVLFIFVMIWLFPTKGFLDKNYVTNENINEKVDEKLESIYGKLFADNIESMKIAAKDYFTNDKLPVKKGDKVTLTLKEMLDKKLLLELKDSNNNTCDVEKSYVEVTKMDNDYQMKVQLTCSEQSDYVLVTLGCHDLCNSCETDSKKEESTNPKPTVTKYLYEYRLDKSATYSNWSNWSNWSTNKEVASNLKQIETKNEKVITGYKQVYGIIGYETEEYTDYQIVTESVQTGVKTVSKVADTKTANKVTAEGTYSAWKTVDTVTTTNKILYNSDTVKYNLKSTRKVLNCENSCAYDTIRVYEKQTRTYTAGKTSYSCSAYGNSYTLSGTSCVKYENVTEPVYELVTKNVPVTKTREVAKYGYTNGDPIYETVTKYRYRTRTVLTKASTSYKYSESKNDSSLLNLGYKLTGNKKAA